MHTHVDFCMPMQLSNNNKKGMCTSAQIFACSCNFWLASEKLQFHSKIPLKAKLGS